MMFESGTVPEDWKGVVIISLYKVRGDKGECKNCRGISLLDAVIKLYDRILIDRVQKITVGIVINEVVLDLTEDVWTTRLL